MRQKKVRPSDRADQSAIGARVRALRAATGWGQAKFAAAAGVSKPVITKCEHAEVTPDLKSILGIASAFGVSVNWLVTGQGPIFADEPPGLVKLAQPDDVQSFRAAVQLLSASPVPLDFALLEYVPATLGDGGGLTGGIWLEPNWRVTRRCGLLLPNSFSSYELVTWLCAWVVAGHRFHGAFALRRDEAAELSMMSPGCLAEPSAGEAAAFWLAVIARQPDRTAFPEIDQVRASMPVAHAERLEAACRGLTADARAARDREALIGLIEAHPELVPPLETMAGQLLAHNRSGGGWIGDEHTLEERDQRRASA